VWHSPTIRNNIICENQAYVGAGIYSDGGIDERFGGPLVIDNRIVNNQAMYAGGGICCVYESCPTIRDNTIENNTAQYGGGVCAYSYSHACLVNNTICDNNATYGGGIYSRWRSNTMIDSCTISGNNYTGIFFEDMDNGSPTLRFNDIINNIGYGIYSDGSSQPIEAVNNWWGNADGPYHPITNPNGLGDTISDNIDYAPWLHTCTHCLAIVEYEQEKEPLINMDIRPNPFTQSTNIRYTIQDPRSTIQESTISIYDASGRLVKSFYPESCVMNHESVVAWYGDDDNGRKLPAGVYLLKFESEGYCANRKIVIVR
jgi:parallel beta-helix repeat protein